MLLHRVITLVLPAVVWTPHETDGNTIFLDAVDSRKELHDVIPENDILPFKLVATDLLLIVQISALAEGLNSDHDQLQMDLVGDDDKATEEEGRNEKGCGFVRDCGCGCSVGERRKIFFRTQIMQVDHWSRSLRGALDHSGLHSPSENTHPAYPIPAMRLSESSNKQCCLS